MHELVENIQQVSKSGRRGAHLYIGERNGDREHVLENGAKGNISLTVLL